MQPKLVPRVVCTNNSFQKDAPRVGSPDFLTQGQFHYTGAHHAASSGAEILPLGLGSAGCSRTCGEFMFCEPSALNRGLAVAAGCIPAAAASADDVQCWAAPPAALRSPEPRAQWEPVDLAENLLRLRTHTTPRWRRREAKTRERRERRSVPGSSEPLCGKRER